MACIFIVEWLKSVNGEMIQSRKIIFNKTKFSFDENILHTAYINENTSYIPIFQISPSSYS